MKQKSNIKEGSKSDGEVLIKKMLETYTTVPPSPKILKRKKLRKKASEMK